MGYQIIIKIANTGVGDIGLIPHALGNRGQIPINSWIPDQVEDDAGVAVMTPVCPVDRPR